MIKKYDSLDTNYLPADGSVPIALKDTAVPLTVTAGQISQAVDLSEYAKLAIVFEGSSNITVDYLQMLGNDSTDSTIEIVKDVTASSGYALKMTGAQKLVFGTPISYVPTILKKITCKAKREVGNTNDLYASVVAYSNGQYINKSLDISLSDYVKATLAGATVSDANYETFVGYIKGTDTTFTEPAPLPDSPTALPTGTDEIALILESTGGVFYIDVIALEEVENSIRDIPDGLETYNNGQTFNSYYTTTEQNLYAIEINVNAYNGSTVNGFAFLHGFYTNGTSGATVDGRIQYENLFVTVPYGAVDCTAFEGTVYLSLNGSTVTPCAYDINNNVLKDALGSTIALTDIVIGELNITTGVINSASPYSVALPVSSIINQQLEKAWKYVSSATTQEEWETAVTELGIESFFTFMAAYTAFINRLFVNNITIGDGDGTASSGFRFRVHTYDQDTGVKLTDPVWDVYYDDRKVFEIDAASGNVMFGNYDETTKSGGILYDYANDKLLGNVAYDQWDLVIESDADLALLTSGTTTYKHVLVTPGTWNVSTTIDLDAHGVERLVGLGNQSIINYTFTTDIPVIKCGEDLTLLNGLKIVGTNSSGTTYARYIIIDAILPVNATLSNLFIQTGTSGNYGVGVYGNYTDNVVVTNSYALYCYTGFYNCTAISNCYAENCYYGFEDCYSMSSCSSRYCNSGFRDCTGVTSCYVRDCTFSGFLTCSNLAGCRSHDNGQYGFRFCVYISACLSELSTVAEFSYCTNISSSVGSGFGVGWEGCTYIDYDSIDCDQEWAYNSIAVTTSGTVLPTGTYNIIKTSADNAYIEFYDGASWRGNATTIRTTGYGSMTVISDGTNVRLRGATSNTTVYYRKKP